jgi:archaellum component FlaF (FlaF/FlaG flagellin family)
LDSSKTARSAQADGLGKVRLRLTAERVGHNNIRVQLTNPGQTVALGTKLTLLDDSGKRILPAYYSSNYISLVPGASQTIDVSTGTDVNLKNAVIGIHGWNEARQRAQVTSPP